MQPAQTLSCWISKESVFEKLVVCGLVFRISSCDDFEATYPMQYVGRYENPKGGGGSNNAVRRHNLYPLVAIAFTDLSKLGVPWYPGRLWGTLSCWDSIFYKNQLIQVITLMYVLGVVL